MTSTKRWLPYTAIFVLAASFGALLAGSSIAKDLKLTRHGVAVLATVTETECQIHDNIVFQFTDGTETISSNAPYDSCRCVAPGKHLTAWYVSGDPALNTLEAPSAALAGDEQGFAVGVTIFPGAATLMFWLRNWVAGRLARRKRVRFGRMLPW